MFPLTLDLSSLGIDEIRGYEGIYFILSTILGVWIAYRLQKYSGIKKELYNSYVFTVVISALIGAKLSHILIWEAGGESGAPLISMIFGGGASITGAILGGCFGSIIFAVRRKIKVWPIFDVGALSTLSALVIGRIGCFLNGDSHGTKTDLPWGWPVPSSGEGYTFCVPGSFFQSLPPRTHFREGICSPTNTDTETATGAGHAVIDPQYWGYAVHPTQIYEAVGVGILAIILFAGIVRSGWLRNSGISFILIGYGILRFMIEFVRTEFESANLKDLWFPDLGLNNAQLLCVSMVIAGLLLMIVRKGKKIDPLEPPRPSQKNNPRERRLPQTTKGTRRTQSHKPQRA